MKKVSRFLVLSVFSFIALMLVASPVFAQSAPVPPVEMKAIGHPTWQPVDFHVFAAPMGNAADGYAEFTTTQIALTPTPNHEWCNAMGIGPGVPHSPPYTTEFDKWLDTLPYRESNVFRVPEFTSPSGVWAIWMVVPTGNAPIGSSPDFTTGPIIPAALFPIHLSGQTFRNNKLWNPYLGTFDVAMLSSSMDCPRAPQWNVGGQSHFPIVYADTSEFGPAPYKGAFEYRITMTDTTGNGWNIVVHFTVRPPL